MAYSYIQNLSKYLDASCVIVLVCQSWSSENKQGSPWTNPCPVQLAERRGQKLTVRQCFFLRARVSLGITKMSLPSSHSEQGKPSFPSVFSVDFFSPPPQIWAMRKRLSKLIFSDTILSAWEFPLKAVRIACTGFPWVATIIVGCSTEFPCAWNGEKEILLHPSLGDRGLFMPYRNRKTISQQIVLEGLGNWLRNWPDRFFKKNLKPLELDSAQGWQEWPPIENGPSKPKYPK